MADVKIILFDVPSKRKKDGTYPITLKVTHLRKRMYFSLGRYCTPEQWNSESGRFRKNFTDYKDENKVLLTTENRANSIIRNFERDSLPFSFSDFEVKFLMREHSGLLKDYFEDWIEKFKKEGKLGTASTYLTTLSALLKFGNDTKSFQSKTLKLSEISYKLLLDFEHWLRTARNCKDTSISVYMRSLRSILNKAMREKLIKRDHYAFDEYRLSEHLNTATQKRAISKEAIKTIEKTELPEFSPEKLAKDVFLFSYYTRGMNFIDIAHLKPDSISEGRLHYVRRKTGKPFSMKLHPTAEKIVQYYLENNWLKGNFIFPIFDEETHATDEQKFHRRKTALRQINAGLKKIAKEVGLENLRLTSYVSRHTCV